MIIKVKDDSQYKGFSIQIQNDRVRVYRHNEYCGSFDTEEDAEEYIEAVLAQEESDRIANERRTVALVKMSEPNYIIYKPQYYTYNHSRQNLYRFKNGKFRFAYERDADKYTGLEADEIIEKYPNLRKVKVR